METIASNDENGNSLVNEIVVDNHTNVTKDANVVENTRPAPKVDGQSSAINLNSSPTDSNDMGAWLRPSSVRNSKGISPLVISAADRASREYQLQTPTAFTKPGFRGNPTPIAGNISGSGGSYLHDPRDQSTSREKGNIITPSPWLIPT